VSQLTEPLLADVVADDVVARLRAPLTEPRFGTAWPATAAIIDGVLEHSPAERSRPMTCAPEVRPSTPVSVSAMR
jgi:hypothetical protein